MTSPDYNIVNYCELSCSHWGGGQDPFAPPPLHTSLQEGQQSPRVFNAIAEGFPLKFCRALKTME